MILEGLVAVVEGFGDEQRSFASSGPRRFLQLGLLGTASFVGVSSRAREVLVVPSSHCGGWSSGSVFGDRILRAYLIRRSPLSGLAAGSDHRLCYSPTPDGSGFAARNRLPTGYDLDKDVGPRRRWQLGVGPRTRRSCMLRETEVLRNPTTPSSPERRVCADQNPARGLRPGGRGWPGRLVAVSRRVGRADGPAVEAIATGGQAGTTSRIENYLGFPSGISGTELAERSVIQAGKFGVRIAVPSEALSLKPHNGHYVVGLGDGRKVISRAVVIATGARYRRLAVADIEKFEGTSVYYAATDMRHVSAGRTRWRWWEAATQRPSRGKFLAEGSAGLPSGAQPQPQREHVPLSRRPGRTSSPGRGDDVHRSAGRGRRQDPRSRRGREQPER